MFNACVTFQRIVVVLVHSCALSLKRGKKRTLAGKAFFRLYSKKAFLLSLFRRRLRTEQKAAGPDKKEKEEEALLFIAFGSRKGKERREENGVNCVWSTCEIEKGVFE